MKNFSLQLPAAGCAALPRLILLLGILLAASACAPIKNKEPPRPDPYAKIERPTAPKRINSMRTQAFWYSTEEDSRLHSMTQPNRLSLNSVKQRFEGWGSRCMLETYPIPVNADGRESQVEVPVISTGADGAIYQIVCNGACENLVYRNAGGGDGSHLGHDAIFPALKLNWPPFFRGDNPGRRVLSSEKWEPHTTATRSQLNKQKSGFMSGRTTRLSAVPAVLFTQEPSPLAPSLVLA